MWFNTNYDFGECNNCNGENKDCKYYDTKKEDVK
jgi:hypothetical protein